MNEKLTQSQAEEYWLGVHQDTADDLKAVCYPSKSQLLNRFFDGIHHYSLRRALARAGISVSKCRLLDVGCGRGRWLDFYGSLGAIATGADISETAVAKCAAAGLTAVETSIDTLPFASEAFELVNSVAVLIHLPRELQVLAGAEMSRVCARGGHIVLLETTICKDAAPHTWPMDIEAWVALFPGCSLVYVDTHHYTPLLLAFWRSRWFGRLPGRLYRPLEDLVVLAGWPLEYLLMWLNRGKRNRGGLQHVMVLRKD